MILRTTCGGRSCFLRSEIMWRGCSRSRRVTANRATSLYGVNVFSRHHGYSNPHSRVSCIKQKILAFDEIVLGVVGVGPSSRPGLSDFEPVAAIREVRMACHHSHAANGEVVLTSKVRVKMFI